MAKQGMKRPEVVHERKDAAQLVPELRGAAKHTKQRANPIIAGTEPPAQKVWHTTPVSMTLAEDDPIPEVYPAIDNDLARDNIENDLTEADKQDLK